MAKRTDNNLLSFARRHRESQAAVEDGVLGIAVCICDLQDTIEGIYEDVSKDTFFGVEENGITPKPLGFKHPQKVSGLQGQIAGLQETKKELEGILAHIEETFKEFGVTPRAMYTLKEDLNYLVNEPGELCKSINRRVGLLISNNPAIPLAAVYADEKIQKLEMAKARVGEKNASQIENIKKLLDALISDTTRGAAIVSQIRHPNRILKECMVEGVKSA